MGPYRLPHRIQNGPATTFAYMRQCHFDYSRLPTRKNDTPANESAFPLPYLRERAQNPGIPLDNVDYSVTTPPYSRHNIFFHTSNQLYSQFLSF